MSDISMIFVGILILAVAALLNSGCNDNSTAIKVCTKHDYK